MSFHAGQTFTFGEQPSATKWQYIWDNDYALADGTGISNDAILTRHILNKNVTTPKMKPTYTYDTGTTGTGSRQSIGTSWTAVTGASRSYTSGATTEMLFIFGTCIANATAAGSTFMILAGGSPAAGSRSDYDDQAGTFKGRFSFAIYEIAAATTTVFALGGKSSSGTTSVANSITDPANGYSPHLGIIAFGR